MARTITFKGRPMTLAGRVLKTGVPAPGFRVTGQDLQEVRLEDFKGKTKVLTSFLSLDTSVCDLQVKEFNTDAARFSPDVAVVGMSKDLPFAQKRFCESFGIKNISVLSDYKTSSFGINYGLLIRELNLLARSIIILDKNNTVRYIQIVPEISTQPDYRDALAQLEYILTTPVPALQEGLPAHCTPCAAGTPALPKERIEKFLAYSPGWELIDEKKLVKEFRFKDFSDAKYFLDCVSNIAEEQSHHPAMTITYTKVRITLSTHAANGLTENDFIMAKFIDELDAN